MEVERCARRQGRVRHWHLQQDRELLPEILQGLRRPYHDRASAHATDRCLCQSAAGIYAPADAACELREQDAVRQGRPAEIRRLPLRPRRLRGEIAGLRLYFVGWAKERSDVPTIQNRSRRE